LLRLGFYTVLLLGLAHLRSATGGRSAVYVALLWIVPMMTSFMFFMLLRDVYQHTNADDGRLTNSRVFYCDWLTRWAVFVHGQGMHVPHHLFPAVPHYRLARLHRLLRRSDPVYRRRVVECHGTFANDQGRPTVLDVLTEKRKT
jgi:fatty acid desaturase